MENTTHHVALLMGFALRMGFVCARVCAHVCACVRVCVLACSGGTEIIK